MTNNYRPDERIVWGEGHLEGFPVALTRTVELSCERKGDPSQPKKSSVDKPSGKLSGKPSGKVDFIK